MAAAPAHHCRVLTSPWPGVYATDIESARHYGKHWHATYVLGVMDGGAHRSSSGSGAVEAFAGNLLASNPGEVHDGRPLGGAARRWRSIYLEPEVIASIAAEAGHGHDVAITAPAFSDERLRRAVVALLEAMADWTAGRRDALACEEALVNACGLMLRDHSTAPGAADAGHGALTSVLERLADAPSPAPTLGELAALAGLGKFQLLRRFSRAYGTTPHAWLLQQRAERARACIRQGQSLSEAAQQGGFADQSHMTRVFVRRFGFTPGAWQRATAAQ
jgi:AraC-like DNA-binding protein